MKSIIGFGSTGYTEAEPDVNINRSFSDSPVRSIVKVRFPETNVQLSYYNDLFDLTEGDIVFVSGVHAGELGIVTNVNRRFKINLADYQKVIARPKIEFHGEYTRIIDKMVSYSALAPSPDEFRSWVIPPKTAENDEDEVVIGEGYSIDLDELESCADIEDRIAERAVNYCQQGHVLYISVNNGIGTAFVRGTKCYEINFRLSGRTVTELYCDCPYPGLCKHNIAVLLTLRVLLSNMDENCTGNFVAIDDSYFWNVLRTSIFRSSL